MKANDKYKNQSVETNVAVMRSELETVKNDVGDIKKSMKADYVTRTEFEPIKDRVDSMEKTKEWVAKIIIGAVMLALLALIGLGGKI